MKNKFLLLLLGLLSCGIVNLFGQTTSNKGTDFWVAYAGHIDGLESRMTLFLTSDVNTVYQVTSGGRTISSGNVTANVVTAVFINPSDHAVYIETSDVKEINKGINVTSTKPISLYCVISNNARTGSTLVLPTAALEQEYYVFSQQSSGISNNPAYSEFTIVGVKDGTNVEITPTQKDRDGTRAANTSFQITLNKGDVYQYQAVNDLTGTLIKSTIQCKPVAVFSGATWAAYCEPNNMRTASGGDNLFQQLFPVTAWGRNFVSAPFYNTLNGNADIIKIIISEDNTTLNINGSTTNASGTVLSNPYRKGSVVTFYSTSPNVIKATSPIAVAQYQTSQTCNLANAANVAQGGPYLGDPEMTILNPIEQTLKDITVYSKLNGVNGVNTYISKYFLNIIIKTTDISDFSLDGTTIFSQFKPIADGEYSYAVVDVTNSTDQHRLIASGGFVAIAYGYGQVESYAYLAGTDLKNLKSNIQVFPSGGTISSTNFCLGTNFDFVLKLPYITNKLTWNLNNGAKIEVVNAPVYTTIVENGQTYYLYKYALPNANFARAGNYALRVVVARPQSAACVEDEEIFTSFDIFSPNFNLPEEACKNTDVQFTDSSPKTGGNIKTWSWDFGDGVTASQQNPKHKFLTGGLKTVILTVTTDIGCVLSVSKTILILEPPQSKFVAIGTFCVGSPIQFNNLTTSTNGSIFDQKWDFGNGEPTSLAVSPITTYQSAGKYAVRLITVSSSGCADTLTKTITVYEAPDVTFKDPGSCVNDIVKYEATAVKGSIVSWLWDFGDGSNDVSQNTLQNPMHKYSLPGSYAVKLMATSEQGCSFTFARQVVISGGNPDVAFEVKNSASLCANVAVSFENKSHISFGSITKIEWIFDYKADGTNTMVVDDNPAVGKIYRHKYPNAAGKKDYFVIMRAYSGQTCFTETPPVKVTVHPAPSLAAAAIDPLCETDGPIQLLVIDDNNLAGTYTYSGTGVSPTGVFSPSISGPGNFNIRYTYQTKNGCVEEKNLNVIVSKLPLVTMPANADILRGGQKQIEVITIGANLTYKWLPGEGLSADNIPNPIAKPEKTTDYTLTVSSNSCKLVYNYRVTVHEEPFIPNVFSPNGDGKNDTWNIKYLETLSQANITIFNRYGQKVFNASPYLRPWDGKLNGSDLPMGVYYYIITPNNGRKKYNGSVTILR